ncbi:MAG: glycosyltransferase family 4 protein [Brumimicrobium sp.]|nr:glycosyltransferase family 4 protein [Brumimicrobium sp.]
MPLNKRNLILIGPLPYFNRKKSIGGATILFQEMVTFLQNDEKIISTVIPSNRYQSRILSFFYLILISFLKIKRKDIVILNVNSFGVKVLWPTFFVMAKILKLKLVLRVFGSHFDSDIESKIFKPILKLIIPKVDILLLETQFLVDKFQKINPNTIWFPNTRKSRSIEELEDLKRGKDFKKRFIFLGHIKTDKGIIELLDTFAKLPDEYKLSIYGEIIDERLSFLINNENYKGKLKPQEVIPILSLYDVLILPTYYDGEGYPGVIIEAYREGLPVISTNWKSIPEIVENGKTGILISPKNSDELLNAILLFNDDNYSEFSQNALFAFNNFDSSIVHGKLFKEIIPETLKIG